MAALLAVGSVGSLVARSAFETKVHSVFEHACNLQADDLLLTICTADRPRGPMTLRLVPASPGAIDLRRHFQAGEAVWGMGERIRTRRTCLLLTRARVWRSPPPRCLLDGRARARHLHRLRAGIAAFRASRKGSPCHAATAAALAAACRHGDLAPACHHAANLIGLGEGLTPSGDDFLAGLLAGLDAIPGDVRQAALRRALADVVLANIDRTNPIAASGLRLAVQGQPGEALCGLREALLCPSSEPVLDAALARLLAFGATSGADMAEGLLAAIESAGP